MSVSKCPGVKIVATEGPLAVARLHAEPISKTWVQVCVAELDSKGTKAYINVDVDELVELAKIAREYCQDVYG